MKRIIAPLSIGLLSVACSGGPDTSTEAQTLTAVCVDQRAQAPSGAWFCGEPREVECSAERTDVSQIFVAAEDTQAGASCPQQAPVLSDAGPFTAGVHTVSVSTPGLNVCSSTLRVLDRVAPAGAGQLVSLWPPNHKMHHVAASDCVQVQDSCDPDVRLAFTYIASDEPINALGDGNTEPDVILGCDGAEIRAERQGPSDGRVYTLGWRAEDGAGNVSEGACTVGVVHDQSGRPAVLSAEAYRVDAPAGCNGGGGGTMNPPGGGGGGGGGSIPPT